MLMRKQFHIDKTLCLFLFVLLNSTGLCQVPSNADKKMGQDKSQNYIFPQGSPISYSGHGDRGPDDTIFSGRFTLTGTYFLGYSELAESEAPEAIIEKRDDIDLYVVPDQTSRKMLPHYIGSGNAGVDKITIDNKVEFLQKVVTNAMLKKLHDKKIKSVSGHIEFVATGFKSIVECGVAYYSLNFVSLKQQPQQLLSQLPIRIVACWWPETGKSRIAQHLIIARNA